MTGAREHVADVVGIGFGPAQLALAYALGDEGIGDRAVFLEANDRFSWHPGMLLPDATMQINFTKDLVTPRMPTHPASFLNYLHEHGRLSSFTNLKTMYPTRAEFTDYLEWAAGRAPCEVRYGRRATAVRWDAPSERFVVTAGDETWHAAHLVAGMGLRPSLPDGVVEGPRVWHTEHLLPGLSTVEPGDLGRVLVVGSGQSAAEAVRHLLGDSPASTVTAVLQSYGYAPADDSPFVNAVFDPEGVDDFYDASPSARDRVLRAHRNTNYSVVDPELIDELARLEYAERRRDRPRFVVRNLTSLVSVRELDETPGAERFGHVACGGAPHARSGAGVGADGAVEAELLDLRTGERSTERVDAVVLATGYRPAMLSALVDDADGVFANLTDGVPDLDRSYRARLRNDVSGAMWMHGADERVHGLSSSLLSNIAVRGGEIARAIAAALAEPGRGEASVPPVVRDRDADRGDAESIEQIGTMARAASIEHAGAAR